MKQVISEGIFLSIIIILAFKINWFLKRLIINNPLILVLYTVFQKIVGNAVLSGSYQLFTYSQIELLESQCSEIPDYFYTLDTDNYISLINFIFFNKYLSLGYFILDLLYTVLTFWLNVVFPWKAIRSCQSPIKLLSVYLTVLVPLSLISCAAEYITRIHSFHFIQRQLGLQYNPEYTKGVFKCNPPVMCTPSSIILQLPNKDVVRDLEKRGAA